MIRVELKKFQIKIKSIAINYHLNYLRKKIIEEKLNNSNLFFELWIKKIKKILIHDICLYFFFKKKFE